MAKFFVVSTASWLLLAALTNVLGNSIPVLFKFQQYFLAAGLFGLGLGFFQEERTNRRALARVLTASNSWAVWLSIVTTLLLFVTCANCPGGLANAISATLQDTSALAFVPAFVSGGLFYDILTMCLTGILLFACVQIFVAPGRALKLLDATGSACIRLGTFAAGAALAWAIYGALALLAAPPAMMLTLGCLGLLSISDNGKLCAGFCAFAIASCVYASSSDFASEPAQASPYNIKIGSFWVDGSRVDTRNIFKETKLMGLAVWLDHQLYQILPVPDLGIDDINYLQKQCGLPEFPANYLALPYSAMPSMSGKDALILGAGIGSEVAQGLSHGLSHITAVESQKWLVQLAKDPYSNAAVQLVVDDPRHFLRQANTKYDLIIYTGHAAVGRPNPFTALNHDDFLLTSEGLADAFALLKDDGQLIVASPAAEKLMLPRQAANLLVIGLRIDAQLTTPYLNYLIVSKSADTKSVTARVQLLRQEFGSKVINNENGLTAYASTLVPTTDARPFMVELWPSIPLADDFFIVMSMLAMLVSLRVQMPQSMLQNISRQKSRAFLLGIIIIMLTCKAWLTMSFQFGNTPPVMYLSIISGWGLVMTAAALSRRQSPSSTSFPLTTVVLWIALFIALALDYCFNLDAAYWHSNTLVSIAATALKPWLPAFLTAAILGRDMMQSQAQSECLGLILIGFSLGCLVTLEALLNGIASLDILAAILAASVMLLTLLPMSAQSSSLSEV